MFIDTPSIASTQNARSGCSSIRPLKCSARLFINASTQMLGQVVHQSSSSIRPLKCSVRLFINNPTPFRRSVHYIIFSVLHSIVSSSIASTPCSSTQQCIHLFIDTPSIASTQNARSGCSSIILPPSDDQFTISSFQFTRSSHPASASTHTVTSFVVWRQPPSFTSVCLSCLYFMPFCHPLHLISCSTNVAGVSS